MNTNNLHHSIRLLEREIRCFPEDSAEADKLAEAVNLILDVLNGDSPDESPVSAGPDRSDGGDRFGKLIRAAERSSDSILDSLSARRRRPATPLERFRRRYADGI